MLVFPVGVIQTQVTFSGSQSKEQGQNLTPPILLSFYPPMLFPPTAYLNKNAVSPTNLLRQI